MLVNTGSKIGGEWVPDRVTVPRIKTSHWQIVSRRAFTFTISQLPSGSGSGSTYLEIHSQPLLNFVGKVAEDLVSKSGWRIKIKGRLSTRNARWGFLIGRCNPKRHRTRLNQTMMGPGVSYELKIWKSIRWIDLNSHAGQAAVVIAGEDCKAMEPCGSLQSQINLE